MNTNNTPFLLIIILLICFGSCTETNSPRPVAENFLTALQERDFEKAKKYGTKETVKLLQILERVSKEDASQPNIKNKIEIISEEISGNKAIVYFKEEGYDGEQKLMLRKVAIEGENQKQWRVVLTKEDAKLNNTK